MCADNGGSDRVCLVFCSDSEELAFIKLYTPPIERLDFEVLRERKVELLLVRHIVCLWATLSTVQVYVQNCGLRGKTGGKARDFYLKYLLIMPECLT